MAVPVGRNQYAQWLWHFFAANLVQSTVLSYDCQPVVVEHTVQHPSCVVTGYAAAQPTDTAASCSKPPTRPAASRQHSMCGRLTGMQLQLWHGISETQPPMLCWQRSWQAPRGTPELGTVVCATQLVSWVGSLHWQWRAPVFVIDSSGGFLGVLILSGLRA
jgi:hypothetical protein